MQTLGHYERLIVDALNDTSDPGHRTRAIREYANTWRAQNYAPVRADLERAAGDEAKQRAIEKDDRRPISKAASMLQVTLDEVEKLIQWELLFVYDDPREVSATVTGSLMGDDTNRGSEWWRPLLAVVPDESPPKHDYLAGS